MHDQLPRHFFKNLGLTFFVSNHRTNSRPNIWVLCKPHLAATTHTIESSEQFIAIRSENRTLIFVHASNNYITRRTLWANIYNLADPNLCVIGDFNVVLGAHECSSGHLAHATPSKDFRDFTTQRDLFDIKGVGNKYTWATRRNDNYLAARLDRALADQPFLDVWDNVELHILPMLCSDHHPINCFC